MTEPEQTPPDEVSLARPQRRLLRRLFNGRSEPITAGGREFLTFQDAKRHLLALAPEERERVYGEMKAQAGRDTDTSG